MEQITSAREFHSGVCECYESLMGLFHFIDQLPDYESVSIAALPCMKKLKDCLDAGDLVCGPD